MEKTKRKNFLALGDSYTIGESVKETERWPVQLAHTLREHSIDIADPIIVAQTGWTTAELMTGIQEANIHGTFDLTTLLIGVNNQYRGLPLDQYRSEFRELLELSIRFSCDKPEQVIVLSIPDWGVTPFAANEDRKKIAREIDAFNRINREETGRAGANYIDITEISRRARKDPSLIADDGLHPSGKMYKLWVKNILPLALDICKKRQILINTENPEQTESSI